MSEADLSEIAELLADDLQDALWIRHYGEHMERLRLLSRPAEKLIYLFLIQSEPQSFTTIRRALSLSSRTVDKALRSLLEQVYVVLDDTYLYWFTPPHLDSQP